MEDLLPLSGEAWQAVGQLESPSVPSEADFSIHGIARLVVFLVERQSSCPTMATGSAGKEVLSNDPISAEGVGQRLGYPRGFSVRTNAVARPCAGRVFWLRRAWFP